MWRRRIGNKTRDVHISSCIPINTTYYYKAPAEILLRYPFRVRIPDITKSVPDHPDEALRTRDTIGFPDNSAQDNSARTIRRDNSSRTIRRKVCIITFIQNPASTQQYSF